MKKEKLLVLLFLSCFIFSLTVVRAELTAQALDAVIKDNNEQLKTALINIQTQHKNEIISVLQGDEFKVFIKEQISSNLKEERIKISLSVFVAILLALIVFSLIRFNLTIRQKEVERIRELKREEDKKKKEEKEKLDKEEQERKLREEAEKFRQQEIEKQKQDEERKLKAIEERKQKLLEMKETFEKQKAELDKELADLGK